MRYLAVHMHVANDVTNTRGLRSEMKERGDVVANVFSRHNFVKLLIKTHRLKVKLLI
jgi:hypothetical protein